MGFITQKPQDAAIMEMQRKVYENNQIRKKLQAEADSILAGFIKEAAEIVAFTEGSIKVRTYLKESV